MMSNHDHDPTNDVLRRAGDDLRRRVTAEVDTDAALEVVRASRPNVVGRGPWVIAAAAAFLLVVGAALVVAGRDAPEEVTVDDRTDATSVTAPDPEGLALGGPYDGKESLNLPVTASPSTEVRPGDTVTATGEGFNPGEPVGVVQCTMDVIEGSAGSSACDLGALGTAGTPDADGRVAGSIALRQIIQISGAKVDCAAEGVRCAVAIGQVSDYDVSGAAEITFADDVAPAPAPGMTVSPSTGLRHGDTVTVTIDGATGPIISLQLCAVPETGDPGVGPFGPAEEVGGACWYDLGGAIYQAEPDANGRIQVPVQVWRAFSPGGVHVVDCAVRACAVFAFAEDGLDPVPATVGFDPDGPRPPTAVLTASPTTDVQVGDQITIEVSGLDPGTTFAVAGCGDLGGSGSVEDSCSGTTQLAQGTAGPDGSWTGTVTLPDPSTYGVDCSLEWACALTLGPGVDGTVTFLPPEPVMLLYTAS